MARFRTYEYNVVNPDKCQNGNGLILKSSWEMEFAKNCDLLPGVLSWGYELIQVPYRDPLTNAQKIYIPDFFVSVAQSDGNKKEFVFEIKPMHEQLDEHARNSKDAALIARNNAKWAAATQWADRHSAEFVVLNERNMFAFHDARKPRIHPVKTYSPTHATKPASKPTNTIVPKKTSGNRSRGKAGTSRMKNTIGKTRSVKRVGRARRS